MRAFSTLSPSPSLSLPLVLSLPLAIALLALPACGSANAVEFIEDPSLAPSARPADDLLVPINLDELGHEVESVRHLSLEGRIHASALPDDVFRARLGEGRSMPATVATHAQGTWQALRFTPEGSAGAVAVRVSQAVTLGFYDSREKTLFLRGGAGDGRRILPETAKDRFVLAHEIEHLLQDQHFGANRSFATGDAALAFSSLAEGDAVLTERAVRAARLPGTEHWVSRMTAAIRATSLTDLMSRHGIGAKELGEAPPIVQRIAVFPYREGAAFVSDLYRAGGLGLVDRAFADPPRSTEQVLHPEKYLAGDRPVPVPAPVAPEGWTTQSSQVVGELGTGVWLGECMAREAGAEHARGWGGDAATVMGNAAGERALLWSTIWDDEEAARRFEADAVAHAECLRGRNVGKAPDADARVARDGRRVAYVQGMGLDGDARTAAALVAVPLEVGAPRPPFGAVTIPPVVVPEEAFLRKGRFEGGAWVSDALGVRMQLPTEFRARPESSLEASMRSNTGTAAEFTVLMTPPSQDVEAEYLQKYLASVRAWPSMKKWTLDYVEVGPEDVDGARSVAHTWRTENGWHLRLLFVPACNGQATAVIVLTYWSGLDGKADVENWMKAFRRPAESSPVCTYLRGLN